MITPLQALEIQDRLARNRNKFKPTNEGGQELALASTEPESKLHRLIMDECRRRGWIALHGSMAHRAMRTVGENDFHCLLPGGIVLFVECKTPVGKLTYEQQCLKAQMAKLGHEMHIVRSIEEFHKLCQKSLTSSGKSLESSTSKSH